MRARAQVNMGAGLTASALSRAFSAAVLAYMSLKSASPGATAACCAALDIGMSTGLLMWSLRISSAW